jgi:ribosomal protein S18 acetylase RimI-like enzyme
MPQGPSTSSSVRAGTPEDAEAIRSVHLAAILGATNAGYSLAQLESWSAGLEAKLYADAMSVRGERYVVATSSDDRIIGFCSFVHDQVRGLYVEPTWKGRGVGTGLLSAAESAIRENRHQRCRLEAALPSVNFYRAHGYRKVAEKDYPTRGGLAIRVFDMVRDFD